MAQGCSSRALLHRSSLTIVRVSWTFTLLSLEHVHFMLVYDQVDSILFCSFIEMDWKWIIKVLVIGLGELSHCRHLLVVGRSGV